MILATIHWYGAEDERREFLDGADLAAARSELSGQASIEVVVRIGVYLTEAGYDTRPITTPIKKGALKELDRDARAKTGDRLLFVCSDPSFVPPIPLGEPPF